MNPTTTRPRSWRIALSALIAVALLAAGCSSSSDDETTTTADSDETTTTVASTDEAVTISLLTFNSPEQIQPLMDAYAVDHPNVTIDVQSVPFGELNAVIESRVGAGDSSVDVFLVDQPRVSALAEKGYLLDLTDRVTIPDGTLLEQSVEWSTYDNRLYVLPVQTSTQLLFYNPDVLAAAGFDPLSTDPANRMTWEDIVTQATAAQAAGTEWGILFEQGASPYQVLPIVESLGGGTGLTGDQNLTPALTTPGWLEGMQWWSDVHETGVIPRGMGFGVTGETFAAGNAAFFLAGPWQIGILGSQDLPFEVGVAPHPYFASGDAVTPTGSFTWGVNPASEKIDAAVEFAEFVSLDPVGSAAIAAGDPNIPTNTAALTEYLAQDSFQQGVDATIADLIEYEAFNTARLRPLTIGYIQYETIVGAALEDIRNGLPIDSTLSNAESELTSAFSGLG